MRHQAEDIAARITAMGQQIGQTYQGDDLVAAAGLALSEDAARP